MHIVVPAHADQTKRHACVGLVAYDGRHAATAYFSDGSAVDIMGGEPTPRRRSRRKSPDLDCVAAGSVFNGPSEYEFVDESVAVVAGGRCVELRRTRFHLTSTGTTSKTLLIPPGCQAAKVTTTLVSPNVRLTAAGCLTPGSGSRCNAIVVDSSAPDNAKVYRHTLAGDAGVTGLTYVKSTRPGLLAASCYQVDPADPVDGEDQPPRISGRITLYDGNPGPDNDSNRLISLAETSCVAECMTTGLDCLFAVHYMGYQVSRYEIDGRAESGRYFVGETNGVLPWSRQGSFSIAASGCGRYVAVGLTPAWSDYRGEVCVYDATSMQLMFSYETHTPPDVLAFHLRSGDGYSYPDLFSGHSDGTVYRWNLQQQASFRRFIAVCAAREAEDNPTETTITDHVPPDPLGRAIDL